MSHCTWWHCDPVLVFSWFCFVHSIEHPSSVSSISEDWGEPLIQRKRTLAGEEWALKKRVKEFFYWSSWSYSGKVKLSIDCSVCLSEVLGMGAADLWLCRFQPGMFAHTQWCLPSAPVTSPYVPSHCELVTSEEEHVRRLHWACPGKGFTSRKGLKTECGIVSVLLSSWNV
jgi:hypothetical protein